MSCYTGDYEKISQRDDTLNNDSLELTNFYLTQNKRFMDFRFVQIDQRLLEEEVFPKQCCLIRPVKAIYNCLFPKASAAARILASRLSVGGRVLDDQTVDDAVATAPDSQKSKYRWIQGRHYFLQNDYAKANACFDQIFEKERTAEFYAFQGQTLLGLGRIKEAGVAFGKISSFRGEMNIQVICIATQGSSIVESMS